MTTADTHAHDHAHDHDHPPFLAHHWETPQQQFEAGKLGMWLFLATEVLLFGGLFCGYAVWRSNHPDMFKFGSQFLNTTLGAVNTGVLILSSLTMASAVTMAQKGRQKALVVLLCLTLLGACGFLVIKYFEYTHKFHEGWYPGLKFYEPPGSDSHTWADYPVSVDEGTAVENAPAMPPPAVAADFEQLPEHEPTVVPPPSAASDKFNVADLEQQEAIDREVLHEPQHLHPLQDPHRPSNAHMFFNIYFMMTGLHGIHVFVGIIMLSWLLTLSLKGRFGPEYFTPVDLGGLYWHIVDLIWIFLFPLFYLI